MQRNPHFLTFLILPQTNKNVIPGWHRHNPKFGNCSKEHPECYKAFGVIYILNICNIKRSEADYK